MMTSLCAPLWLAMAGPGGWLATGLLDDATGLEVLTEEAHDRWPDEVIALVVLDQLGCAPSPLRSAVGPDGIDHERRLVEPLVKGGLVVAGEDGDRVERDGVDGVDHGIA